MPGSDLSRKLVQAREVVYAYALRMAALTLGELGRGVYSPAEAGRIAQLESRRVRRWIAGYDYRSQSGELRHSDPIFPREHRGTAVALTFMDLVEVLYVRAFLRFGVTMPRIRVIHDAAREEFETPHPFAVKRFETDGQSLFYRFVRSGAERIEDRHTGQLVQREVFAPLIKRIDYLSDSVDAEAYRYWPLGRDTPIVVDPKHAFGEAVVAKSFVPTRVIYAAHKGGGTTRRIASWYAVEGAEVRAAIEFEELVRRRAAA